MNPEEDEGKTRDTLWRKRMCPLLRRFVIQPCGVQSRYTLTSTSLRSQTYKRQSSARADVAMVRSNSPALRSRLRIPSLFVLPSHPGLVAQTISPLPHHLHLHGRGPSTRYHPHHVRSFSSIILDFQRLSTRSSSREEYWRSDRTRWPSVMKVSGRHLREGEIYQAYSRQTICKA